MITRVAQDKDTIQLLLIDVETYQFVYSKKTKQIEVVYEVQRKEDSKTYYNPVQLDIVNTKYLVEAYRKIKNGLQEKKNSSKVPMICKAT